MGRLHCVRCGGTVAGMAASVKGLHSEFLSVPVTLAERAGSCDAGCEEINHSGFSLQWSERWRVFGNGLELFEVCKGRQHGASRAIGVGSLVPRGVLFFFWHVCGERGSFDGDEVAGTTFPN